MNGDRDVWRTEPVFWERTFAPKRWWGRPVFHLVAERNGQGDIGAWCGYLGRPIWWGGISGFPAVDVEVEAVGHASEYTGYWGSKRFRPHWPGYTYPGFDCGHVGDWYPTDLGVSGVPAPRRDSVYRPLTYVTELLERMATRMTDLLPWAIRRRLFSWKGLLP